MPSPELVIGSHKLQAEFFEGHVRHRVPHPDASQGEHLVEVVETWKRGRELGRGGSGTVFLEESETGKLRAVKDIAKDKNTSIPINYERELVAMAVLAKARENDAFFVQFLGWYECDNYIHIAMEYISEGHLRHYLEAERSESEAKVVIRQLLEGLVVIHQKGFAHRDLKPENIFVVSKSPIRVKIGDFGLAKLVRTGTAFRTRGGTLKYLAPEVEFDTSSYTSEYTNAVDIWSIGCITHELLTKFLPFQDIKVLMSYCSHPKFPRENLLSKNISQEGIEFVESTLAYPPRRRIAAKRALDSEWLRPECGGAVGLETGEGPTTARFIESQSQYLPTITVTATKSPGSLYSADTTLTPGPEITTPLTRLTQSNTPVATLRCSPQPTAAQTGTPLAATPPPVPSEKISEEQRHGEGEFATIDMAAAAEAGFDPSLMLGRDKAVIPEPADTSTSQGAGTPQEHQLPQGVAENSEGEGARRRRMSIRDLLQGVPRPLSRGNRTGSLLRRPKTWDSANIHTVAGNTGPGFDSVLLMPEQRKNSEGSSRKRYSMKWLRRSEVGERRAGTDTPRNTPPASIYHASEGWRWYWTADSSDASRGTGDSARETRRERKTRMEWEKREEKEAKKVEKSEKGKQKVEPTAESASPEPVKSRWGGLLTRFAK